MTVTRNVIISGATSCLGLALTNELLRNDYQVIAIIRKGSKSETLLDKSIPKESEKSFTKVYSDFSEYYSLKDILPPVAVWINFAWEGTSKEQRDDCVIQERNAINALNALRCASSIGCKIYIEAGSQAEYGIQKGVTDEETKCFPITEYGKAKLKTWLHGKHLSLDLGISYLHLRIFSVFGEGKNNDLISYCIKQIKANNDIMLSACCQNWNLLDVKDAAVMIERLICRKLEENGIQQQVYNIASPQSRILKEYISELCHCLGYKKDPIFSDSADNLISLYPSTDKINNEIGKMDYTPFVDSILRLSNI